MKLLDRVRRVCLAHPGAYEKIAWSAPTFRVGERQFAMPDDFHRRTFRNVIARLGPDGPGALVIHVVTGVANAAVSLCGRPER